MTDSTDKSLKVLALSISDMAGGAARAAYRIHKAVRDQGVESRMLVKTKGGDDASVIGLDIFEPKHGLYRAISWVRNKFKNKIQQHNWSKYPHKKDVFLSDLRGASLHGALHKIEFDILHIHWINLRFLNLQELKNIRQPIVWTLHDCWPLTGVCHYFCDCKKYETTCGSCPMLGSRDPHDLSNRVFEKKRHIYSCCRIHVVTPSKWLGNAARSSNLFGQFPGTVIPNPIDTVLYSPGDRKSACRELGVGENKKIILYGAMKALKDRIKGFAELMAALAFLEQHGDPESLELVIFGNQHQPNDLKTRISVRCLGVIQKDEDIVRAYRAAHVTVSPSLTENLSNVMMESLACGTPVAAFNIGGNSDLVDHLQNGYLAEAFSPRDLARGIAWCLENNQDGNLSRNARAKVERNYTPEKVAGIYRDLYSRLAGGRG